ncbi:M48 family metalloprotease [Saccharothrix deserti]|uniref:M48 family metalloprotease n=1 Tax=Saccharothrix deserti TaxID=2593674 RepID=UPI00131BF4C7|nr:M48 family metalloprotease [Saccharothrix deserti]
MTVEELRNRHVELLRDRRVVDRLDPRAHPADTAARYHTWTQVAAEPVPGRLARLVDVRVRPAAYRPGHLHDQQRTLDALQPEVLHLARAAGRPVDTPVFAGVFPTGTLDALSVPVPGRGILVLVNTSLLDLLGAVLKIMTVALPNYGTPPLLTSEQASYALAEAVNAHLYGNGAVEARRLPELSGQRLALVALMARRATQFVLAHEVGHVLAGHLVHARRITDPDTPVGALDAQSVGWPREHDADRLAATIMLHTLDDLGPRELDAHEPCLVGALLLVLFLHEVTDRLTDELGLTVPFAGNHPPPVRRIQTLVEHLTERVRTPRALDLAADVASWLEDQLTGVREWFRRVDEVLI